MSAPLGQDHRMRELLGRAVGPVPVSTLDLDRVVAEGGQRRHRRRLLLTTGAGAGAVAGVAAVVVAAGGLLGGGGSGQVVVAASPQPPVAPTSSWQSGDPSRLALLDTTLERDGDCLVTGPAGQRTVLVWPKGYTARWAPAGPATAGSATASATRPAAGSVIEVLNSRGDVVARSGEHFSAGGGGGTPPATGACTGYPQAFFVEQDLLPLDQSVPAAVASAVTPEVTRYVQAAGGIAPVNADVSQVSYQVYSRPSATALTLCVHFTATFRSGGPGPFTDGENTRFARLTQGPGGAYQWDWSTSP